MGSEARRFRPGSALVAGAARGRGAAKRPCERCFLAAVIFLAAALPRVVMSCPRTGGGRRGDPHPPCGAKSVPLFPCCLRSRYRADGKPVVDFRIADVYCFVNCISKRIASRLKCWKKAKKRCAYILYFRKIAYLCSPFWTMEIDFLTIKGQFKKCQLFNS